MRTIGPAGATAEIRLTRLTHDLTRFAWLERKPRQAEQTPQPPKTPTRRPKAAAENDITHNQPPPCRAGRRAGTERGIGGVRLLTKATERMTMAPGTLATIRAAIRAKVDQHIVDNIANIDI